jgi:hypothetical protein
MNKTKKQSSTVYIYKGWTYLEQPKNTRVIKAEYDMEEKLNRVYLKKNHIVTEVICILLLLVTISIQVTANKWKDEITIPQSMNYYNGTLYTNIIAGNENKRTLICEINGEEYALNAGDYIKTISIDGYTNPTIDIKVTNNFLIFEDSEIYTVSLFYIAD